MTVNIETPTGLRQNAPGATPALKPSVISPGLRAIGLGLRAVFILLLAITIARVSLPQSETLMSVYETPGDLVRLLLGAIICVWIVWQAFLLPKDANAYRTWLYISLVGIPFTLICLYATW
ncbi:MAG: hypothetical protein JO000_06025 [Alphaproteobacteria bacterium]|nr:hypothetical protein [Alphaproteobacteria bacterium]